MTESAMKLYMHSISTNARRPRVVIHHLGLPVEEVVVDMGKGGHRDPAYLALNPHGRVPTLVDGNFVLWESNAIAQYLADSAGATDLSPTDLRLRAEVTRWICFCHAHWAPALGPFVYERVIKRFMGAPPDEARLQEAEKNFHSQAVVAEDWLKDRPFFVAGRLTLADIALAPQFSFAAAAGIPWGGYPNLQAWYQRVAALPAWQATEPPRL